MTRPSRARRRWLRRAALVGGAAALASVARTQLERSRGGPPWDPSTPLLPGGDERRVTTADGVELAVSVAGPDEGRTVVLAHCWMGSRAVWGPVARRLVDEGHRVVLYDQRGHGASGDLLDPPTVAQLGDDLRSVVEALDVRDAVFAGHSMGGMTVQSYAAEHPVDFKERACGVLLVSTAAHVSGRPLPEPLVARIMSDRVAALTWRGTLGYTLARRALGRTARRADVELTMDGCARTTGPARAGFLSAMAAMDLRAGLAGIDVPTVVMVGSRDRLTPPKAAKVLATGIGGAELVTIPDAGHMLPLETPDEIATKLAELATAV